MTSSSNKKVIIIGATSGIGRELAILYARSGCTVGITGRRTELLQELKTGFPKQIETECFDVTGNDNISHLESLLQKTGGMDLLIYNSGYGEISEQLDWTIEKATTLINVNGFIEIVHYAFNHFVQQQHGQIAATSSIASLAGNSQAPAYSASKAFMSVYMEGLYLKAKRLQKTGARISITDIQPGFVKTKMAKGKGRFWEAPVDKAAKQIHRAIETKRFRAYITKRWWLIASLIKIIPGWLYRKLG